MGSDPQTEYDPSFSMPTAWDGVWDQHFQEYQGDIRHAYYVAAVRRRHEGRILEIGAGSFRDVVALNRWGYFCEGVDFSAQSVEKAHAVFPQYQDRIKSMDAAHLEYADGAFDLTLHSGLWGYFDDARILELGAEQARVTRTRMIATVHNAHNRQFREYFVVHGEIDPLYRIRFFSVDEIGDLMRRLCRRVTVLPVLGERTDRWIRRGSGPVFVRWVYRLYGRYQALETSQRLMCIGEVGR
jgi:ubiquinone/menaquinone biosynthesis C-methylase UbiE